MGVFDMLKITYPHKCLYKKYTTTTLNKYREPSTESTDSIETKCRFYTKQSIKSGVYDRESGNRSKKEQMILLPPSHSKPDLGDTVEPVGVTGLEKIYSVTPEKTVLVINSTEVHHYECLLEAI